MLVPGAKPRRRLPGDLHAHRAAGREQAPRGVRPWIALQARRYMHRGPARATLARGASKAGTLGGPLGDTDY